VQSDKINRNSIPEGGGSQEGGRQTALLPQKTRKIYSYSQLQQALSQGLRNPAAVPVNRFQLFVKKNGNERPVPVGAFSGSDPQTIRFYLEWALENGLSVLDQGVILITKKTAEKLRENRRIAKGDIEKIVQLDLQAYFGPDAEVVRLAHRVFIDIMLTTLHPHYGLNKVLAPNKALLPCTLSYTLHQNFVL
jgi:hypothetical protein